jgi:glycosyltransferase involved in cell wall biosynthesis
MSQGTTPSQQERSARPKVLFIHQGGELYGSDLFFYRAVKALSADVEPVIVLDNAGPLVEKLQEVTDNVTIRELGVLRRKYFSVRGIGQYIGLVVGSTAWLARTIRREKVALVYSNTIGVLSGALAARLTGRRHIWYVLEIITEPAWLSRLLAFLAQTLSERIVAVSGAVVEHLQERWHGPDERFVVVHGGIDPGPFDAAPTGTIRREYGIDDDTFLVALVGRVHFWKGQDYLIDAAHRMKEAGFSDFRALIVGDVFEGYESLRQTLRDRASSLGVAEQIVFCGFRSDVPAIVRDVDVLVVPSLLPEPFGLVSLEGMACGKPVIATAHGGAVEIVVDGATGYLVPPDEPQAMAVRLMELAGDKALREQMGERGRRRLEELFTLEHFNRRIREAVLGVLYGERAGVRGKG